MSLKKYLVEGFGALVLTLVVGLSLAGSFPVPTPILAGLTLGLFVYTVGAISGAHLNPAVTVGLWSLKKISAQDALGYIVAQFVGAGLASILLRALVTPATLVAGNSLTVMLAEFLGMILFTFGIAAVVHARVPADMSGIAIGWSLFLGIFIASSGSNGVLNPAVAFGIGSFSWVYALAPVVGSVAGMNLYKWFTKD